MFRLSMMTEIIIIIGTQNMLFYYSHFISSIIKKLSYKIF